MKQIKMCIVAALAGGVLLTGCGQKQEAPSPATPPITKLPTSAPAAPQAPVAATDLLANAKDAAGQATTLAKASKFQEALALLQKASAEVQANPEAKKLIDDAVAKIKQMMADAATKAATDKVGNALSGIGK